MVVKPKGNPYTPEDALRWLRGGGQKTGNVQASAAQAPAAYQPAQAARYAQASSVSQNTAQSSFAPGGTSNSYFQPMQNQYAQPAQSAYAQPAYSAPYATPFAASSYDDFYSTRGYDEQSRAAAEMIDAATRAAVLGYEGQKRGVNADADELARQAYISYENQRTRLPQQLSAAGYSGGMADSQQIGLSANLQNNQQKIGTERETALWELDRAIQQAQLAGDAEKAQALQAIRQAASAEFNQYARDTAAMAQDDYWSKLTYDQNASQFDKNLALQRDNFDLNKTIHTDELKQLLLENAYRQAEAGDMSGLKALGIDPSYLVSTQGLNTAALEAQIAATKASGRGGGGSGSGAGAAGYTGMWKPLNDENVVAALGLYSTGVAKPRDIALLQTSFPGMTPDEIIVLLAQNGYFGEYFDPQPFINRIRNDTVYGPRRPVGNGNGVSVQPAASGTGGKTFLETVMPGANYQGKTFLETVMPGVKK